MGKADEMVCFILYISFLGANLSKYLLLIAGNLSMLTSTADIAGTLSILTSTADSR